VGVKKDGNASARVSASAKAIALCIGNRGTWASLEKIRKMRIQSITSDEAASKDRRRRLKSQRMEADKNRF